MIFSQERINVYFNEATGGRYVPRAVLMDLEPGGDADCVMSTVQNLMANVRTTMCVAVTIIVFH